MQEQHTFIIKVIYYQQGIAYTTNNVQIFNVYTERLLPVKQSQWLPVMTALSVLKGFRRLSTSFGLMRVLPGMVGMNEKD